MNRFFPAAVRLLLSAIADTGADTATAAGPGVLVRGGDYIPGLGGGTTAGPLAVGGTDPATNADPLVGFRCAR